MCGIVGIAQQSGRHRFGAADGGELHRRSGMGLVSEVLRPKVLDDLPGQSAIGHVRYSTAGDPNPANAQPFLMRHHRGPIAVAHNGNLVDAAKVRAELEEEGSIFQTQTDTETVLHLVARSRVAARSSMREELSGSSS